MVYGGNGMKRKDGLTQEVWALIKEARTFSHQDCGTLDADGFGCIRCRADDALSSIGGGFLCEIKPRDSRTESP